MDRSRSRRRFLTGVCATGSVVALPGCGSSDSSDRSDTDGSTTAATSADETPESTETVARGVGPTATQDTTATSTATPGATATLTETSDTTATTTATPGPISVDGHVRPPDDPGTVPQELVCSDEQFERRDGWIELVEGDLQWGAATDDSGDPIFALRVDRLSFQRAESATVTLTNVSHEVQSAGNPFKSNFDVYTDAGWQDPRGWADGRELPVTDDVWEFEPGEQFRLTVQLTAEGVVAAAFPGNRHNLVTCPGLPAGRYRFATAAPDPGPVGVAFDLVEPRSEPTDRTDRPN